MQVAGVEHRAEDGAVDLLDQPQERVGVADELADPGLETEAQPGTPEFDSMVREGSVAGLVDMWSQSSNDHHEGSLAVQEAVAPTARSQSDT